MSETDNLRLAFFDIELFENGAAIRGAMLITDIETKPYEFRITGPVRPSPIQRVLYGDTLDDYVHIDLIGVPLIRAAKEKLSLILVANPSLLRIRPKLSSPMVLIRRDSKSSNNSPTDADDSNLRTVTITAHRDFPTEAPAAQAMLASIMQKRDLLEPFERLRAALAACRRERFASG